MIAFIFPHEIVVCGYSCKYNYFRFNIISNQGSYRLSEKGIAVYERDRPFEGEIAGLEKYDERKYGRTVLSFFRRA